MPGPQEACGSGARHSTAAEAAQLTSGSNAKKRRNRALGQRAKENGRTPEYEEEPCNNVSPRIRKCDGKESIKEEVKYLQDTAKAICQ